MTATNAPATTGRGRTEGEVRPQPTRRQIEDHLMVVFPAITTSMANRIARKHHSYASAAAEAGRRLAAEDLADEPAPMLRRGRGRPRLLDPTGEQAVNLRWSA